MIDSWRTEGYQIKLEDTGAGGAAIVHRANEGPEEFGQIDFDPKLNRHIVTWNRDGCLAIEQYKRDFWDNKFYYAMAKWRRSQPQEPDELEAWREHQEQEFQDRLRQLARDDV